MVPALHELCSFPKNCCLRLVITSFLQKSALDHRLKGGKTRCAHESAPLPHRSGGSSRTRFPASFTNSISTRFSIGQSRRNFGKNLPTFEKDPQIRKNPAQRVQSVAHRKRGLCRMTQHRPRIPGAAGLIIYINGLAILRTASYAP